MKKLYKGQLNGNGVEYLYIMYVHHGVPTGQCVKVHARTHTHTHIHTHVHIYLLISKNQYFLSENTSALACCSG